MSAVLTKRRLLAGVIFLLLLPTVVAGVSYALTPSEEPDGRNGTSVDAPIDPANLTVVTTQGADHTVHPDAGRMVGVRTSNRSIVWVNDEYLWYYDVEPLDNETLLFVAHERQDDGSLDTYAVTWNWVEDETLHRFEVPIDTHDVDKIGPDEYAVADKEDHRAYVYNRSSDETTWEYRFRDHFPDPPAAGVEDDYTHLNDVDLIDDGDSFLLDPRNFNRVIAVDRETKETEWTLGEQNDTSILNKQHHPVILEDDPLTVLVGDSRNNRIVEYRRTDDEWEATWTYGTGLNWPRAVKRLPNGNTLITDSGNDRVLEIAPNKSVVWEFETEDRFPYDVERVALGDEPAGPTMASIRNGSTASAEPPSSNAFSFVDEYYRLAAWVLPIWVGKVEFLTLAGAVLLTVGWVFTESTLWIRRRVDDDE